MVSLPTPDSLFLFARPSFWEGMGRVLDLGGTMTEFNSSLSEEMADGMALRADWKAIGRDLLAAMEEFKDCIPPFRE